MMHAYDKICLERAAGTLGRMLDYSVYSLRYDVQAAMDLFIASGTAARFERGDIRTICGMSGIELAYEVFERSGLAYERALPRYTKNLSAEYWCGYVLAHIQWETCAPFSHIMRSFSIRNFISGYGKSRMSFLDSLPLDTSEDERSEKIRDFGKRFAAEALSQYISAAAKTDSPGKKADAPLKRMRKRNGLSQSGLAKASGIPVRTIQQYEQGQKDIRKARAESLVALSTVLGCDPSLLL